MLQLTLYQEKALNSLRLYLQLCNELKDANTAFYNATREIWGAGIPYRPVGNAELREIPYICLRLPTGGGKTLLACHSIAVTNEEYLGKDHSVVLWLVPSNAIKDQTINALKNRNHPYRQALNSTIGSISVVDLQDALSLQESTLTGSTTIIVATLQAFRVEDKEGRKVYASAGSLEHHFTRLPEPIRSKLLLNDNGVIDYSLANVLRINRPLVIVDEAHNARTSLSFDTLAHFRPSAIVEFTATPATKENPSNVLHSVSAAELKAEDMIKLPIRLATNSDWQSTLANALTQRASLEEKAQIEAQRTGEYIRPLMLLQAQNRSKKQDTLDADSIEKVLLEQYKIPKEQIAVATGNRREIDGIDLLEDNCKIRYIITVQALKEGWDCPFAYVLCSVNETRSSNSVEQVLGRVLRLPYCTPKKNKNLNKAYAFVTSQSFADTAEALIDSLVQNGFNKQEAQDFISYEQDNLPDLSISQIERTTVPVIIQMPEVPEIKSLPKALRKKIEVDRKNSTITLNQLITTDEEEAIKKHFVMESSQEYFAEQVSKHREYSAEIFTCPADQNILFEVPVLCIKQDDLFERFEEESILSQGWELANFDARLNNCEFNRFNHEESEVGEIDVDNSASGNIGSKFISDLNSEMMLIDVSDNLLSDGDIIFWLGSNLLYYELTPDDKERFIVSLINDLRDKRNIPLTQLIRKRFKLRKIIDEKIKGYRKQAHKQIYQEMLFGNDAFEAKVSEGATFIFKQEKYPANNWCSNSSYFKKHYYSDVGELKGTGEEFDCALYIDKLDEVEFWVRNLERQPLTSFWLQTSTDKFYPDFVCKLNDGRMLVIEYKGADRWSNDDSKEKRRIGELWEAKSNGKCLFIMPNGNNLEEIKAKISS